MTANDGAGMGITSERALETILGGRDSPAESEEQTPEQVRARVMAAKPDSYGSATDCITRAMLRLLEADESSRSLPLEHDVMFVVRGTGDTIGWSGEPGKGTRCIEPGTGQQAPRGANPYEDAEMVIQGDPETLWDRAKAQASADEAQAFEGATGFMAGFAANQARWLLGMPVGGNPAIVEVAGPSDAYTETFDDDAATRDA